MGWWFQYRTADPKDVSAKRGRIIPTLFGVKAKVTDSTDKYESDLLFHKELSEFLFPKRLVAHDISKILEGEYEIVLTPCRVDRVAIF